MQNVKEFYILNNPIDTKLGTLRFLKVNEYIRLTNYIPYLNAQKFEIVNYFKKQNKKLAEYLSNLEFIEIIRLMDDYIEINSMYEELFLFCFGKDAFKCIENDNELNFYRELICKMNCIELEKKNPNPEIQRFLDMEKALKNKKNKNNISFESIYTSIWATIGREPNDLTLYNFYALFSRIGQMKNYETTTLYRTVSGEIDIIPWYGHVDLFNKEENLTSLEEFGKNAQSIISKK